MAHVGQVLANARRVAVAVGLALAAGAASGQLITTAPALPREGDPFRVVYEAAAGAPGDQVDIALARQDGGVVVRRVVRLEAADGALTASLEARVPGNGLLRATVLHGSRRVQAPVPVLSRKREVNLIYFGMDPAILAAGHVRWATLVTSVAKEAVPAVRRRGIVPLRWCWGSNLLSELERDLKKRGAVMTLEAARDEGRRVVTSGAADARREGLSGLGMDEFGGYAATDFLAQTRAFVRGMIDARKTLQPDDTVLAWHAGPLDSEMIGLYRQSVDFVLPEAYLLDLSARQLGTEVMHRDMEGRLGAARANDMFAVPGGRGCRIIPSVDATDQIATSEYEVFVRMLRRDFPEARGIAFFNVLSKPRWRTYRVLDALCYEYYILPVITFGADCIAMDRFGKGGVAAWVSNIGGMDSGPVRARLLVNGRPVASAVVPRVPAGFSRLDDRARLAFGWKPRTAGTYRLRVELADAGTATVLEPAVEVSMYLRP